MNLIDQFAKDDDARDFLELLTSIKSLEDPAPGIAKLLLAEGPERLSPRQRYVLEQAVGHYVTKACKRCGAPIPWSEMYAAYDNGGLCSWDAHMSEKED